MVDITQKIEPDHREVLKAALFGPAFERFITALIILNAVILAALTYDHGSGHDISPWAIFLTKLDQAIIGVFMCEIVLKIYACRRDFFKSGWNIFDLLVVGIGVIGSSYPLTVFRSLRVLRVFRLVTRVPSMRVVVESFLRSLPGIGSVITVMLLILFVYSVIGTGLFGAISPEFFGSMHSSAFTLFTVLTLEGWPDIARDVIPHSDAGWIYFVSYIALNSFVVLNLMIAVIINAMQTEYEEHAEEEREDILEEIRALRADVAKLSQK